MLESTLWKRVLLAVHRVKGTRLFRNNVGQGWTGSVRRLKPGQKITAQGGEILIRNPRPLHAGLLKGSGDGIGWRTITITPDMVGQRVAVFLSVETKTPKGKLRDEQQVWHRNVRAAGGISIIARSPEQAHDDLLQVELLPPEDHGRMAQ